MGTWCVHLIVASVLGVSMISLISIWVSMSQYTNRLKESLDNENNDVESIRKGVKENDKIINEMLKSFAGKDFMVNDQKQQKLKIS